MLSRSTQKRNPTKQGHDTSSPTFATIEQMISHNGEIEIEGGGLPVWDGGRGAGTGWSTHSSTNASALLADKTVTGSTIVTCSVEFPEITSERLEGLDSAGTASDE